MNKSRIFILGTAAISAALFLSGCGLDKRDRDIFRGIEAGIKSDITWQHFKAKTQKGVTESIWHIREDSGVEHWCYSLGVFDTGVINLAECRGDFPSMVLDDGAMWKEVVVSLPKESTPVVEVLPTLDDIIKAKDVPSEKEMDGGDTNVVDQKVSGPDKKAETPPSSKDAPAGSAPSGTVINIGTISSN